MLSPLMVLICLMIFIPYSNTQTAATVVTFNDLYAYSGRFSVTTLPSSVAVQNPLIVTLTFGTHAMRTNSYSVGYSIQSIDYTITNQRVNYSLVIDGSQSQSNIQGKFYSNFADKVAKLDVFYMLLEDLFGAYKFQMRWLFPRRNFIRGEFWQQTQTGLGPYTMSGVGIWSTIVGADTWLTGSLNMDLYLANSVPTSTSINFRVSSIADYTFYLQSIVMVVFVYNSNQMLGFQRAMKVTYGTFDAVNNDGTDFYNNNAIMRTTNTLVGIYSYHIMYQTKLQYSLTLTSLTSVVGSTQITFKYLAYNFLIFEFIKCPSTSRALMVSTRMCYALCPTGFVQSATFYECQTCPFDCLTCDSSMNCLTCNSTLKRQLGGGRCLAEGGFYDDGTNTSSSVLPCPSTCKTCNSPTNCFSCKPIHYLAAGSCNPCMADCQQCTSATTCDKCALGYTYDSGTTSCVFNPCSAYANCGSCTLTSCLTCQTGYKFNSDSTACLVVCGDGVKRPQQDCDDGNKLDFDGCSSTCLLEVDYSCVTNATNTSECSMNSLVLKHKDLVKHLYSNSINITFTVTPGTDRHFKLIDWPAVISQVTTLNYEADYQYDNNQNQIKLIMKYKEDVQRKDLTLRFTFPTIPTFANVATVQTTINLLDRQNLALKVYSQQDYVLAQFFRFFSQFVALCALIFYVICYFGGKLVAIQFLGLIQITALLLGTLQDIDPIFHSFSYMNFANGFSVKFMTSTDTIERKMRPLQITYSFLDNFNIMSCLIILPALAALACYLINKAKYSSRNQTLVKLSRLFLIELVFYGMMFSAYYIFLSLILSFSYFLIMTSMMMAGLAINVLFCGFFIVYLIIYAKYPLIMGEFKQGFNKQKFLGRYFYVGIVFERIISSVMLAVISVKWQPALLLPAFVALLIMIIIRQPYLATSNIRSALNNIVTILIIVIYLLYGLMIETFPGIALYGYAGIMGLIVFSMSYNGIFYFQEFKNIYEVPRGVVKNAYQENNLAEDESKRQMKDDSPQKLKEQVALQQEIGFFDVNNNDSALKLQQKQNRDKLIDKMQNLNENYFLGNNLIPAFHERNQQNGNSYYSNKTKATDIDKNEKKQKERRTVKKPHKEAQKAQELKMSLQMLRNGLENLRNRYKNKAQKQKQVEKDGSESGIQ